MRVLVTGGCGFIGSNYIRHHLGVRPNDEIVNLDKLTYAGRLENLIDVEGNPNYEFVRGDICSAVDVAKAMEGCSAVINFAAESHVDRAIADSKAFAETNFFGVRVLCEEAKKRGVEKFVQVSTDEVYGQIVDGSFSEESVLRPRNPYSAAKAAGELLAIAYFETFGLPVVVTRSSNNFGPFQFPEKIIPRFVTNLLRGRKVPVYGKGEQVRDWLFVLDNCEAIRLVLEKGGAGEIYNIAGGNEVRNIDLTKMVLDELGMDYGMIEFVEDRPGHDFRYSLDCSKIRRLGWRPRHEFRRALRETVEWYKANEGWWRPLVE